jgi:DNA-binding MarR family transcriptional regulator
VADQRYQVRPAGLTDAIDRAIMAGLRLLQPGDGEPWCTVVCSACAATVAIPERPGSAERAGRRLDLFALRHVGHRQALPSRTERPQADAEVIATDTVIYIPGNAVAPDRWPVDACTNQPIGGPLVTDCDLIAIGWQLGLFLRRAERFRHGIPFEADGRPLERASYGLLARVTEGPARLSALAADLSVDLSTVSRQVATLESTGLVRRTVDPTDRRASLIEATEIGVTVFTENREKWLGALEGLFADWTTPERKEFVRLFARLNQAMQTQAVGTNVPAGAGMETV